MSRVIDVYDNVMEQHEAEFIDAKMKKVHWQYEHWHRIRKKKAIIGIGLLEIQQKKQQGVSLTLCYQYGKQQNTNTILKENITSPNLNVYT